MQRCARNSAPIENDSSAWPIAGRYDETDNVITEAAIGVLKETGSSGNIIVGNRFFNTPVPVQDPQFIDVAKLIWPKR